MAKTAVMRKPKAADAPAESREQKLVRLAGKRVEKACKAIALIGNLAAYKPTDQDVDNIMSSLGSVCASVESRLRGVKRDSYAFKLREIAASH